MLSSWRSAARIASMSSVSKSSLPCCQYGVSASAFSHEKETLRPNEMSCFSEGGIVGTFCGDERRTQPV
ncbi:hypothetical protein AB1Y20_008903 [Prymnesium parvum]|uniref:Uncharacterized protein n=1 Tax=Prymnesium parvum TaxID=97485 RepID=A0AB34K2U8_PRYPA